MMELLKLIELIVVFKENLIILGDKVVVEWIGLVSIRVGIISLIEWLNVDQYCYILDI